MKNRNRDKYTFANINFLGKCNVDCFFCLGKDIEHELSKHNQLKTPVHELKNLDRFLDKCRESEVDKLYITGQNTDSLLYAYLEQLIKHLRREGFKVGLRTNGYLAEKRMYVINMCDLSVGYSIHSLTPEVNKMIMGRSDIPNWSQIIGDTKRGHPRVSIVLNRCNEHEIFDILEYLSNFRYTLRYVQVRRPSTDTRSELLAPDVAAYERIYTQVSRIFPMSRKLWGDAEEYTIYGLPVIFWRTTKTTVNSLNYFSDGTISDMYFVVEGYMKYKEE